MRVQNVKKFSDIFRYDIKKKEILVIDENDNLYFLNDGKLHNDDGPAVILGNEDEDFLMNFVVKDLIIHGSYPDIFYDYSEKFEDIKIWYKHGKIHRENKPAISGGIVDEIKIYVTDNVVYNKKTTRPSLIFEDVKIWTNERGNLHRENGPAYISNVIKEWYQNGKVHRANGPAIIFQDDGYKGWYIHGNMHRMDGPAIIDKNYERWWINNVQYNEERWKKIVDLIKKKEEKLAIKYARVWYQKCDKPGTKIWDNNIKKGWDGIEKLIKIEG